MKNDGVKNHGYGTKAEILALDYAFHTLELKTVFADAIHKKTNAASNIIAQPHSERNKIFILLRSF